jgi:hypothetical protein
VSAAGGEPLQVTALDSSRQEASHRQPEFLPDGRHFLYAAFGNRVESNGIFIADIQAKPDPKNVRRLMGGAVHVSYASPGYLLFPQDNNLMAQPFDARRLEFSGEPIIVADHVASGLSRAGDFSVSANGVLAWRTRSGAARQLAWFDRSGKQTEGLNALGQYLYPNLSPDGNRVAVNELDAAQPGVWSIWLLDLVRNSMTRFTFGRWWANPIWSPDGHRIVFGLGSPPDYGLYWKDTSGAGSEELLLKANRYLFPTDWSRDGRFLLFDEENRKTKWDIWLLPLSGDRRPVPVVQTEFNEKYGQFSPDSRWIAYASDESGRYEVYVRPFNGGAGVTAGKWPVSTAGGFLPRWRGDGKELFFVEPDGKLRAVPVKLGSTFEAGVPVTLFDTYGSGVGLSTVDYFSYAVRGDGQRFLLSRGVEGAAARPVNICLNWLAGVKK